MNIIWLGTASLLIESGGHKILFDPYLRKLNNKLSPFPLDKICDVEAIFITHPHFDHYADVPDIMKYTHCPIYTNARGVEIAKSRGFDLSLIKRIDFGNEITFGDLSVKAHRGRHVIFDRACVRGVVKRALMGKAITGLKLNRLNNHFKIDLYNDVFSYQLCEGDKSVLILGSANVDESVQNIPVNLLIYPYQGRSDMLEYSLNLVKNISPEMVLLDHFDNAFPPLSSQMNVEEFKRILEDTSDIKVTIPTENEKISF